MDLFYILLEALKLFKVFCSKFQEFLRTRKKSQISQILIENFLNFFPQFGDSQKLRLVRILRSTVMVRVGGGWVALDEFLVKNDPCRGMLYKNYFILPFQNKFIEKKIYFKNKRNFVTKKKLKDAKEKTKLI